MCCLIFNCLLKNLLLSFLLLIAFGERSHNAVLSRVLWEWRHGRLHRSCAPIWPPRSRGETNYIIAKPCAVHFFGVRKVRVFELWTFTIKNSFFSLEILLETDIILYSYVWRGHWNDLSWEFFPSVWIKVYKITLNARVEKKLFKKWLQSDISVSR